MSERDKRLPPGQKAIPHFPALQFGTVPAVDLAHWRLRLWGAVETPCELDWETINRLPKTERAFDLHCVTRWSNYDTRWSGFTLQALIDAGYLSLLPEARFVMQHAPGYSVNLPLSVVMSENFLFATHYDGQPLTAEHGFPLRGLPGAIPGRDDLQDVYLWKGAKWLNGLEFTTEDNPGYWERRGYSMQADIWKEQRYAEKE